MGNDTERGWTIKDAEDAARLLQGMAQRGKKAVEAVSSTQIQEPGVSLPVIADGSERLGVAANSNYRPHSVAGGRNGEGRDRNAEGWNAPVAGRCCFQRFGE